MNLESSLRWARWSARCAILALCTLLPTSSRAELPQELIRSLEARAAKTKSVYVRWNQTITKRRGSSADGYSTSNRNCELRIDGGLVDFRQDSAPFPLAKLPMSRRLWDGTSSRQFTPSAGADKGSLIIESEPYRFVSAYLHLRPVFINYRPFHPHMGKLDATHYQALAGDFEIGGARCVVLEESGDVVIKKQYWFDETRDYLLVRYTSRIHGVDSIKQEITYQDHPVHGPTPTSWKSVFLDDETGELNQSDECKIELFEVNVPIDPGEFSLTDSDLEPQKAVVIHVEKGRRIPPESSGGVSWIFVAGVLILGFGLLGLAARRYVKAK